MAIPADLPDGFIALNSPVAFHARALLLMVANTDAYQEWCGVSRWQDACKNLDILQSEVQAESEGQSISTPNVCLQIPGQTWASLDRDRPIFSTGEFELVISAATKHDSVALGALEFIERVGRTIDGIGELSGAEWTGETSSWPVISSMTETGAVQLEYNDNTPFWSSVWQITVEGPK